MDTKYLKRASSGLWLYRRKTPKALKERYDTSYIQKSLGTHSHHEALIKRNRINVEIDDEIARATGDNDEKDRFYSYYNSWREEYVEIERKLPRDATHHPMEDGEPDLEDSTDMVGWDAWNAMKTGEVPEPYRLSLDELLSKWLKWAEDKKNAKYISTMKTSVRALEAFIDDGARPEGVSIGQAQLFIDDLLELGKSSNTVTHYKSKLQELWRWALSREYFDGVNPWVNCKIEATAKQSKPLHFRNFTNEELNLILSKTELDKLRTPTWPYPFALHVLPRLLPFLGTRLSELANAKVEQFVVVDERMFFEVRGGKTANAERIIPVSPTIRPLVDNVIEQAGGSDCLFPEIAGAEKGAAKAIDTISSKFSKLTSGFAKVEGYKTGLHSFRGHFATALEQIGCPEDTAAKLAGHKNLSLTYGLYSKYKNKDELWRYVEKIHEADCLRVF